MSDIESVVIGKILNNTSLLEECDLTPQHFENESLATMYQCLVKLHSEGKPIDVIFLAEEIETLYGWNAVPLLNKIADLSYSASGFNGYVEAIRQNHTRIQAKMIAHQLLNECDAKSKGDFVSDAITQLMQLGNTRKDFNHTVKESVTSALEHLEYVRENNGLVGVKTGLTELDESLGGYHNSDLIVIGARPAMGKTAFLLSSLEKSNVRAGVISAEQGYEQVGMRLISINGSVSSGSMRTGNLDEQEWPRLTAAVNSLRDRPVWINDEPSIDIDSLKRQAREWKFKNKIEILFVDYLQKIAHPSSQNSVSRVTHVVNELKNLARELDIPVVALAQVKREVDSRNDSIPLQGDMSDASAIEKEADQIMTLYRDEVYNPESPDKGIALIRIVKNRHGPLGDVRCLFKGKYFQFKDIRTGAA